MPKTAHVMGPVRESTEAAQVDDDHSLLAGLIAGDDTALTRLYDRYAAQIRRTIWRILGPDADYEDLVNETFVHILTGAAGIRDAQAFPKWVSMVTVNVIRGELRKRRVRRRALPLVDGQSVEQVAPSEDDARVRTLVADTFEILDQLSVEERLVFTLRYVEGYQLTEVAERCGVSLGTTKRRLRRAQKRFIALARHNPEVTAALQSSRWGGDKA